MFDSKAFVAAMDKKIAAENINYRQLSILLDLNNSMLFRIKSGATPKLEAFFTIVRWLGVPAETFIKS